MSRPALLLGLVLAPLAACADGQTAASAPSAAPSSVAAAQAAGGSVQRPAKLGLCSACHGDDGRSRTPGTPHLAGQDVVYLERSLSAYRNGERRHVPMNNVANALQPADMAALAAWYAAQPGFGATGESP